MADIIIVEDNKEIGELLADFLTAEGFDTYLAVTGEEALEVYAEEKAKLVILDLMLPGIDGFAVCAKLRETEDTPILIVSAKVEKEDKLNGLLLGADDYIEKPYDIDILIAKVKGIFRRRYSMDELTDGNLVLQKRSHKVFLSGTELQMTAKEFELLTILMENKGKVLKKEDLFRSVWGSYSESEAQTLTVHIKWLREKIETEPKQPKRIQTVWGIGYRFEGEEDAQ